MILNQGSRKLYIWQLNVKLGGEGGIRTPGSLATTSVFETDTFDHSVTSPSR